MRSNRLHGCLVVAAALLAQASSASAQDQPDEKKTDDKTAPEKVAQAEPSPPPPPPAADQPGSSGPATPGGRDTSDEQLRKMVEEQVAKMRPKGPAVEFSGYARAGVGLALRGGKQVCFVLNGADAK
ncbi:MAG TPA: hypothetical protein VK607_19080, partial [Kofleriaceae bacterium]|nr:hypothetical protein [Kofleriaceae bacterium]